MSDSVENTSKTTIKNDIKFSKEQIISSNKFTTMEKDILKALLDDKQYSLDEVNKILRDFNKKEVSE